MGSRNLEDGIACIFHRDLSLRQVLLSRFHNIWKAVTKAISVAESSEDKHLQDVVAELHWARRLIVKSFLIPKLNDADWSAADKDLRLAVWRMNKGVSNTKSILEDVFNYLQNAARANKNKKVNEHRAYALAATCPSLKESTADMLQLSPVDWQHAG